MGIVNISFEQKIIFSPRCLEYNEQDPFFKEYFIKYCKRRKISKMIHIKENMKHLLLSSCDLAIKMYYR